MLKGLVAQNNEPVPSLDSEYISGLLGEYNLTPLPYANRAKNMLSFRGDGLAGQLLVIVDEIAEFHVV